MTRPTLPASLWRDQRLYLPAPLADALRDELAAHGRYDEACGPSPPDKERYGGEGPGPVS